MNFAAELRSVAGSHTIFAGLTGAEIHVSFEIIPNALIATKFAAGITDKVPSGFQLLYEFEVEARFEGN